MTHVRMNGKDYSVSRDGSVEVHIPAGEPRVMRNARSAFWRSLKYDSKTSRRVRKLVASVWKVGEQ